MPLAQIDAVVAQVADALDDAAVRGLVHRDVKPANILLDEKGRALLTDFGIARDGGDDQLTGAGLTIGTVARTRLRSSCRRCRWTGDQTSIPWRAPRSHSSPEPCRMPRPRRLR